ncbi:hypothetical protein [Pectobacterium versatile]|uniref:hypothetical protein n=1 Tax=Pectobacterium versatile TaxID=2488639 RepID=UPI001B3A01A3|nr:hypothetical protein [Pectobacterium versatile]
MTTLSTTQLIEAMRTVAVAAETEQGREKLNAIANRMEMLVAANAGMDLQLNSIRTALNIPVNTSVQAGVIAETSRLNDEVLSLRSELSESVALANKLRRTAKEHQEENQQLRTGLAAYDGEAIMVAEPIGEIDQDNGSVTWLCDVPAGALVYSLPLLHAVPYAYAYQYAGCETCEGFQDWRSKLSKERPPEWMLEDGKVTDLIELFARAVPPAASQPDFSADR